MADYYQSQKFVLEQGASMVVVDWFAAGREVHMSFFISLAYFAEHSFYRICRSTGAHRELKAISMYILEMS